MGPGAPPRAKAWNVRGAPLVLVWWRIVLVALLPAGLLPFLVRAGLDFAHSSRTLESLALPLAVTMAGYALFAYVMLRGEEANLQRDLRAARSGTSVARSMALRRRERAPFVARLVSTTLGPAAVLLAEGDREEAARAAGRNSWLMSGGRLRLLRTVLEADLDRARGTEPARERCVATLRALGRIGNREADRYATHVLVKATLELGDEEGAAELLPRLATAPDEEERLYAVWLRVWFNLDEGRAPLEDAEVRLATLLARSHGAEELVKKLEERTQNVQERAT
jgi:hypothetical protein